MKLAIATRIYRPEPAAASIFLGALADAALRAGDDVEVLTVKTLPRHGQADDTPVGWGKETVKKWPVLRDKTGYVRGYVQYMSFDVPLFFRILTMRRPQVLYVEPPPTTGVMVRLACAIRRIPYVYDAADLWFEAAKNVTDSRAVLSVLKAMELFAWRGASAMTTISKPVARKLHKWAPRVPVRVAGFGANTATFYYEEPGKGGIRKEFLYAGTYTEVHGAEIFLRAFARFAPEQPEWSLRFIGNGAGSEHYADLARELGIGERVSFELPVSEQELRPQLAKAAVTLASVSPVGNYEYAFATKIYASLACGCPVIFTGSGPTNEFLASAQADGVCAGQAVAYDEQAVAEAMRRAAERPLERRERQKLARWTSEKHSISAAGQRAYEVLKKVASGR